MSKEKKRKGKEKKREEGKETFGVYVAIVNSKNVREKKNEERNETLDACTYVG